MRRLSAARAAIVAAFSAVILQACVSQGPNWVSVRPAQSVRVHPDFAMLPGWVDDNQAEAIPAVLQTCNNFLDRSDSAELRYGRLVGTVGDWKPICHAAVKVPRGDQIRARHFFEEWFKPVDLDDGLGGRLGTFTGYYAPVLRGSWTRTDLYSTPIHRRPENARDRRLSRAQIAAGGLDGKGYELLWVDNPVDAFFVEIQGSGTVELADGSRVGIRYDGQDGRSYYPVGRALVESGIVVLEDMSMDFIRAWMGNNPDKVRDLMNLNESYVYFKLESPDMAIGAHDVPLTPMRSVAVDHDYYSLGLPFWIEIDHISVPDGYFPRLMIAQDIGGAIKGPIRGDVFWGHGDLASTLASGMKAEGRWSILVPRATLERTEAFVAQR